MKFYTKDVYFLQLSVILHAWTVEHVHHQVYAHVYRINTQVPNAKHVRCYLLWQIVKKKDIFVCKYVSLYEPIEKQKLLFPCKL